MLAALAVAFVLGALCALVVSSAVWLYTTPLATQDRPHRKRYQPPSLPEPLRETTDGEVAVESCKWFNAIVAFLFQELRDSLRVKSFIMKKIHTEFSELMFTKKEGRMIEQLTVRDYDLGTSLPVFTHAVIHKMQTCEGGEGLEEVAVDLHVDYSGQFWIGIDADLVFDKVAYVAIRVLSVKGHGQLQFTTQPFTHWSFAFSEEPQVDLEVESTFEGRSFPQLSSFIEKQLRRWIRQKHTLPARKTRFKPFFLKPQPQNQLHEVYVHNKRVTVGRLSVEVVKCSRLHHPDTAGATYCTLDLSSLPCQPLVGVWRSQWALREFRLRVPDPPGTIGIRYRLTLWSCDGEDEVNEFVVISEVLHNSVAARAGVRKGDIIVRVNQVKVRSVRQVRKVIIKTKRDNVLLLVKRPPKHVSDHMLSEQSIHQATPPTRLTPDTLHPTTLATPSTRFPPREHSDGEMGEGVVGRGDMFRHADGDSISLCGVTGERGCEEREGGAVRRRRGSGSDSISLSGSLPHQAESRTAALSSPHAETGEEVTAQRTREAEICQQPKWNQKLVFEVGEKHHYLNVTIPLMDVALECLSTRSGRHHQRYVLVASESGKATASRTVLQAEYPTRGRRRGEGEEHFVGNILLCFKHTPPHRRGDHVQVPVIESRPEPAAERQPDTHHQHPFIPASEQQPSKHQFRPVEMEGTQKCDICHKRIWALKGRVQVCQLCAIRCHKKCVAYCCKEVTCSPSRQRVEQLHSREDAGFTVYEGSGEVPEESVTGAGGGALGDGLDGFVTVGNVDSDFVKVEEREEDGEEEEEEGLGSDSETASLEQVMVREERVQDLLVESEVVESEGESGEEALQKSSDEELFTPVSGSESEEEAEQMLAEFGHMLYVHLPLSERPAAIQNKISELQREMERVRQLVRSISAQLETSHGDQDELRLQLKHHENKLEPLKLLMRQHKLALSELQPSSRDCS